MTKYNFTSSKQKAPACVSRADRSVAFGILFSILLLLLVQPLNLSSVMAAQVDLSQKAVEIREQIDIGSMRRDIVRLASLKTRVTGYEAAEDASKYIFDRFVEIGLQDVDSREFEITVPIDEGGILTVLNEDGSELKSYQINSIWPNLVRTSFVADGVKHKVLEGESLEGIASAYQIDIQNIINDPRNAFLLKQQNDGRDNDGDGETDEEGEVAIVPGNKLFIPTGGLEGPLFYCGSGEISDFNGKDIGGFWYRVQPDDTLNSVAYRYRISPSSIMDDVLNAHLLRTDDNIDNDEDGEVDEEGEMAPFSEIATWDDDGLDNDGDGIIDEIPGDNTDGIDNDRDNAIDEPDEFVEAFEAEVFVPRSSVVLINFENSGTKWINATMLGASVVIFIEPKPSDTIRGEAENKFLTVPANIPRFWISRKDAAELMEMLGKDGGIKNRVTVRITAKMTWQKRIGQNIRGFLEGSDPQLKDELVIIEAYYDSMSVVPALSPGADPTGGIATLLELARLFKKEEFRPARSILFLATSGHFQGLAGMRAFMEGISQDSVRYMQDLRRDINRDLFEFQELSRKIVLAIDRGYLVDLPPSFFDKVDDISGNLDSLATTLSDLGRTRNSINSLKNVRRDETEKRKKKGETIKKREKERFTPEEQERLNANLAKYRKDALQTTNFLREIVDQMANLQDYAISKSRKAEKELVENIALPMARLDVWAIEQLLDSLNRGEIGATYSREYDSSPFQPVHLSQENEFGKRYEISVQQELRPDEQWVLDEVRKLNKVFHEWEISDKRKFVLQYSQYKLLDRHLTLKEMDRIKKARKTLASAKQSLDKYVQDEQQLLKTAYNRYLPNAQKVGDDAQLILAVLEQLDKDPRSEIFNTPFFKGSWGNFEDILRYYLSTDDLQNLKKARKQLMSEDKGVETVAREQINIINLALRNARREGERLNTLQKNAGNLTREYTNEEQLALKHYLNDEEFNRAIAARTYLFAKFDEDRLINSVLSRAKNDIPDLQSLLNEIDTMETSLNDEQKRLLKDNLTTLRNSRIRNIHKQIEKMSRFNRKEMRRKIKRITQAIALQSDLNRYYTSLFISIDLSTQSHEFGVFNKGWFYDQQPDFTLRREFAPIGNKLAEYADNADFGKRIKDLWTYTDDQIRQAVLANQWTIASNMETQKAIEGKTLETLVDDYYDTLIGLSGVSRLMKLQFEQMKDKGEPSKDMLKDMDYIRKEVERFIRNDIRTARKDRKSQMRLFSKLDSMLALRDENPAQLTDEEVDDITTLISVAGLSGTTNFVNAISATGGKTWQTYIPGKIAFDSEVATLAGMTGIAFATINDARVLVDTPLDT
ncbi:MAG: M28 family peptidase, partial [Candidatus Poribacteria bacterium]